METDNVMPLIFPCNSCGACCRRVGAAIEMYDIDFPYDINPDGSCSQLGQDNKCKVYDTRPDICRIGKMIEMTGMDKKEAYIATINACNTFMQEDGITNFIKI